MIPLLYYAFRVMAGIGFAFMVLAFWTAWVWKRTGGRLDALLSQRKLLLAWTLCIPLPYIAVECGWIVREVGRQPWIVYGLLRTRDAVSAISTASVSSTIAMFVVFYVVLLATFLVLARKWFIAGPDVTAMPPSQADARAAAALTEY
jgi:cytochrome d ubiquinol oxidase subunit I